MEGNFMKDFEGEYQGRMQYPFGCCTVFASPMSRMDFIRRAIGYGDAAEKFTGRINYAECSPFVFSYRLLEMMKKDVMRNETRGKILGGVEDSLDSSDDEFEGPLRRDIRELYAKCGFSKYIGRARLNE